MDRRGSFLSVFVLTFAITAVVAFAQEDEDLGSGEQGKGLIPFTEEQEKQFRKEHKKIEKINLNEVGWERVNKERKKRGYYELDSEFKMPKGLKIAFGILIGLALVIALLVMSGYWDLIFKLFKGPDFINKNCRKL